MRSAFAAVVLAASFLGCGGGEDKSAAPPAVAPSPAPAPAPASTPAAPTAAAPSAPAAPAGSLRGSAEAGKALYAQYCSSCHGATGHGDGPVAGTLNPKPANHTDHQFMATLTDEHLYQVISKGGASVGKSPMMAPWGGVINDQGIKDLIAYLRQLSST